LIAPFARAVWSLIARKSLVNATTLKEGRFATRLRYAFCRQAAEQNLGRRPREGGLKFALQDGHFITIYVT